MKKVITVLIIVLFLITIAGCSENNSNTKEKSQLNNEVESDASLTETPTDNPLEGKTAEDFVYTELRYQVPYHGAFLIAGEESNDEDTAQCRLPQLSLNFDSASEINQEIHNELDTTFQYYSTIDASAEYIPVNRVDYLCYLNSSVLSLVIESRSTDTPNSHFYVFNIDVLTGERLGNEELINLSNVSVDEAYDLLYDVIESKYTDIQADWITPEMLESTKSRSLSTENLQSSGFYYNGDGRLSATYRYDWFAGAGNDGDVCVLDASIKS